MRFMLLFLFAGILGLHTLACGQEPAAKLKVGDPAPALSKGEFVKGEPVRSFEAGKVYVLEFWATWCGPCIHAIPHVTELQHKYKDKGVIFIGQNVFEEDESKVKPFVEKMGDKMDYRVALDSPSGQAGQMSKNWMEAAGQNGIPCTFIIDQKSTIAWIGHPMEMAPILEQIVAGTFDSKAYAVMQEKKEALTAKYRAGVRSRDWASVISTVDELAALDTANAPMHQVDKARLLILNKQYDEGYALMNKIIPTLDNPQLLNNLAWAVVDPENPVEKPNYDIALAAAQRACEKSEWKSSEVIDTLARVYFLKGDKAKAIETQKKAIDLAPDDESKAELKKSLDEYSK